jgi:predicted RND superfamily exporter protein
MTSLTDIAAFAAGTLSKLEAIKAFCIFAAVAIAVDYILQITLFLSFLTWDRQRAANRKLWGCCCIVAGLDKAGGWCECCHGLPEEEGTFDDDLIKSDGPNTTAATTTVAAEGAPHNANRGTKLQRFLKNTLAPFVLGPVAKPVILLVFCGLTGVFGFLATTVNVAQTQEEIAPAGSFITEAMALTELAFFPTEGTFYVAH